MKSQVIFVVALFLFSNSVLATFKIEQALAQIDQHPVGNGFLSLIQMNIMAGDGPLDTIKDALKSIKDDLDQLASEDQAYFTKYLGDLEDVKTSLSTQITNLGNQITAENVKLVTATNTRDSAQSLLEQAEKDKATAEKNIKQTDSQYDIDIKQHDKILSELEDAIKACDEATGLLDQLTLTFIQTSQSETSLVQLKTNLYAQLKEKMERVSKAIKKHLSHSNVIYAPMIEALVEMASKADKETVTQIKGLIAQLKAALEAQKGTETTAKKNTQDTYVTDNTNNQADLKTANDAITTQGGIVSVENEKIKGFNKNIEKWGEEKKKHEASKETTIKQINDGVSERDTRKKDRDELLNLLKKIQTHFDDNIDSVSDYLKGRINDSQFDVV